MKRTAFVLASSCAALVMALGAVGAHAQSFAKPEDAIHYRQSALFLLGTHFGRLAPVMRGQAPYDAAAVQRDALFIQQLAELPWGAFGEGTQGGKANPDIWKEQDKFRQASETMRGEMAKFVDATKSGDLAQVRAAYGAVGASCKACHDSYRQR